MSRSLGTLLLILNVITLVVVALLCFGVFPNAGSNAGGPAKGAEAPDEDRLVAIQNELARVSHSLTTLESSKSSGTSEKKLDTLLERLDELASQVYEVDRENQQNLMRVQSNLMRRLSKLQLGGTTKRPEDPMALKKSLAKDGVDINYSLKFIRVKGRFIIPKQALELMAIVEGGKTHEALMMLDCKPSAVREGLSALGLKPGAGADWRTETPPTGAPLWIYVTWDGLKRPWRLEDLVVDARDGTAMTEPNWVFSGSGYGSDFRTGEEYFLADVNRCVIGLVHKFSNIAVVTSAHKDAGNEHIWVPNPNTLPEALGLRRTELTSDGEGGKKVKEWDGKGGVADEDEVDALEVVITISAQKQDSMEWR